MRYAVRTFAEAMALTAFVLSIGMLAETTLPFARPASTFPTRFVGCAEPPARAVPRAGRDAIAELLGRDR